MSLAAWHISFKSTWNKISNRLSTGLFSKTYQSVYTIVCLLIFLQQVQNNCNYGNQKVNKIYILFETYLHESLLRINYYWIACNVAKVKETVMRDYICLPNIVLFIKTYRLESRSRFMFFCKIRKYKRN